MAFWWIDSPSEIVFPPATEKWRRYAEKYAGSIPTNFVLAWLTHESSGKQGAVSKLGERGLFQIHPEGERETLRLGDADWERLLTDPDFAMVTGIKLILHYSNRAAKLLNEYDVNWDSRSFWSLTKLFHAATAMPKYSMIAFTKANGAPPSGFGALARWAMSAPEGALAQDPTFARKLAALAKKVFPNSSKVGNAVS